MNLWLKGGIKVMLILFVCFVLDFSNFLYLVTYVSLLLNDVFMEDEAEGRKKSVYGKNEPEI